MPDRGGWYEVEEPPCVMCRLVACSRFCGLILECSDIVGQFPYAGSRRLKTRTDGNVELLQTSFELISFGCAEMAIARQQRWLGSSISPTDRSGSGELGATVACQA